MSDRTILSITGTDRVSFLQGLVSNDVTRAEADGIVYAALLTAQGKFLADFFIIGEPDRLLLDVATPVAPGLMQRLSMYRLRADVQIAQTPLKVARGTGPAPKGAFADPRHPALGWRLYGDSDLTDGTDWTALRVAHLIPETGTELGPDSYILEAGFEGLHGVDFRKGCYVGQEVTARMKHKTDLRKGFTRVQLDGPADPGTPILSDGREVGRLCSRSADLAIAFVRFDWATGGMTAGAAKVTLI